MRTTLLLCLVLCLCALAAPAQPRDESLQAGEFIVVCPITDMIADGVLVVVERAVRDYPDAKAFIFAIDTPGGRVDSAIEITKQIISLECPTIAYVNTHEMGMGAISAGALISYACDTIVMTSDSNIGASAPIIMSSSEPSEEVNEKTKSFLRGKYRALGEANGHDPLLGEAMVDNSIELRAYVDEEGYYTIFKSIEGEEPQKNEESPQGQVDKVVEKVTKELAEEISGPLKEIVDLVKEGSVAPQGSKGQPEGEAPAEGEGNGSAVPPEPMDTSVLICAKGELLTLTAPEAQRYGLIDLQVDRLEEVIAYYDYAELKQVEIVPTKGELLFAWLTSPTISGLLLLLGLGGLYFEFKTPGFGAPGIIGLIALSIFFGSYLVIGLAEWFDILLVLVGLVLLAIEIFVIPGFGIFGVSGIGCLMVGTYLSLTRVTIPKYEWDFVRLDEAAMTIAIGTLSFVALAAVTWKLFPRTPLFRWLVLEDTQMADAGYVVQTEEEETLSTGLEGVSTSMLRPAGRGRFGNKTYDIVTRGEYIQKNCPVRIIEVNGNRYVVEEVKETQA